MLKFFKFLFVSVSADSKLKAMTNEHIKNSPEIKNIVKMRDGHQEQWKEKNCYQLMTHTEKIIDRKVYDQCVVLKKLMLKEDRKLETAGYHGGNFGKFEHG